MRFVVLSTSRAAMMGGGLAVLMLLTACSPTLDWREVRVEGGSLSAWLPCKPQRRVRELELAGERVSMEMLGCRADGSTWGLTSADVGQAARIEPALAALRRSRADNLGAPELSATRIELPAAAGRRPALMLHLAGRDASGAAVVEHSLLFAAGTRVVHLAVIGREPGAEALGSFFGSPRLAR